MNQENTFIPLLIITLLAVAVPVIVSRLPLVRLPIVVGEILAGMAIGRSGFDLVQPSPTLSFLADFGFTFLMFLSGLEVDFETLLTPTGAGSGRPRWQAPIPLALISFSFTVLLGVAAGFGLVRFDLAKNPLFMGLILSTTSLSVVVPILKEQNLTRTFYGQALLVSALTSDFVTLLLLSLIIAILSTGFSLKILLSLLLLGAFITAARISRWVNRIPLVGRIIDELSHATAQIRVRGAFALMVVWVVMAEALGVEVILGAFLAGAILSLSLSGQHEAPLREKLDAIGYGFFVPIFFITVGARFDFAALLASRRALYLVPILIVVSYLIKMISALIYASRFSLRETLAAGAVLSSRLSLIIAVSQIALNLGLIAQSVSAAVVLLAIVSCTFSPILFSRILPPETVSRRQGTIIVGIDHLAMLLGHRLGENAGPITFISRPRQQPGRFPERGVRIVTGDAGSGEVLEKAGARNARALIFVSQDPDGIVPACRLAREEFGIPAVIARTDDPKLIAQLKSMKVSVVQPSMAVALALEGALHYPAAFSMLMDKTDNVDFLDVELTNPALAGLRLRRLRLPGDALVVGVRRGGEVLVPHGNSVVRQGDILILVGSSASLQEARDLLAPSPE